MRKYLIIKRFLCLNLIGLCTLVISKESVAKEDPPWKVGIIEEVVVQARLQNSAEELISERMNDDVVMDYIGDEFISRVGDSTVASALNLHSPARIENYVLR